MSCCIWRWDQKRWSTLWHIWRLWISRWVMTCWCCIIYSSLGLLKPRSSSPCSLAQWLVAFFWNLYIMICALTLLVGHQAYKKWVTRCWCGYLSGARCGMFAYTRGDQKVLQLGYKKLTLYHTCCHFLTYSHATSMHIVNFCFQLFMPWK